MIKIKFSLIIIAVCTLTASAQIKMNSSGNVGVGGWSPSSNYDLQGYKIYANESRASYGYVGKLGVGGIWSSSNVLTIGNTDLSNGYNLYVGTNGFGNEMYVNGRIIAIQGLTTSDRRIKRNIEDIDQNQIMRKIEKLRGRTYKYQNEAALRSLHDSGKIQFRVDTIQVTVLDSIET